MTDLLHATTLSTAQDLLAVDRAFNDFAQEHGTGAAFLAFCAPDAVMLRIGRDPAIGAGGIAAAFAGREGEKTLTWTPVRAEIAASGDLGYTFGSWSIPGQDRAVHGVYVSIWKRQPDGTWRWVLDGGALTESADAARPAAALAAV